VIDGFNHLQITTRPVPAPELPAQALVARLCSGPGIRVELPEGTDIFPDDRARIIATVTEEVIRQAEESERA